MDFGDVDLRCMGVGTLTVTVEALIRLVVSAW